MQNKQYIRAVWFILFSLFVSCMNDVITKCMGTRLNAFVVLFFRFFFGLVTLLPLIANKLPQLLSTKMLSLNLLRGLLGFVSMFAFVFSIIKLPLVEVVIICWTIPLFTFIFSIFLLKERVSLPLWLATISGFLGLCIATISQKNCEVSFEWICLIPIFAAILFALQDVIIKKMIATENRLTMLLYFSLVTTFFSSIPAYINWQLPTKFEFLMLFILGIGGNLIQYLLFKAFSLATVSQLAPFKYLEFIFSSLFGFIFFAEIPGINTLLSAIILIPSTLYLIYNQK